MWYLQHLLMDLGMPAFLKKHFISSNWIKNEYVFCFPLCMTTLVTRLIYIFYPSYLHDNKKPDLDDSDCLQWINVSYLFILDFRSVVINAFCLNDLKLTYSIIFKYVCPWNIYFVDKCQAISREMSFKLINMLYVFINILILTSLSDT